MYSLFPQRMRAFMAAMLLGATAFLGAALLATPAQADQTTIGAGLSISSSPYKTTNYNWNPIPLLAYEGEYFYLRGVTAGFKALNTDSLEVSIFARYDHLFFDASKNNDRQMKRLDDRNASVSAGVAAHFTTPYVMLYGNLGVDVLDNSRSLTADLGARQPFAFGDLRVTPALGIKAYNHMYNIYYYGVSLNESHRSGMKDYRPSGGFEPYLGLTLDYTFGNGLDALVGAQWSRISDEARDSPMVDKTSTVNFNLGLMYSF